MEQVLTQDCHRFLSVCVKSVAVHWNSPALTAALLTTLM
nr:MAG TPA_asm: hypothetical protein [Bacteriophage sp.]